MALCGCATLADIGPALLTGGGTAARPPHAHR